MWTRSELKERAKANIHESYWALVLGGLLMGLCSGGSGGSSGGSSGSSSESLGQLAGGSSGLDSSYVIGIIVGVLVIFLVAFAIGCAFTAFLAGPLEVGVQRFFMNAAFTPQTPHDLNVVGMSFKSGIYMNVVKIMFLRYLYIWLWSLLFIVPGVIKAYEYRMIPYLLAENPNMSKDEAFALSKQMMDGEKMNAWVLDLSFWGWFILAACTCGLLAIFYVNPYYYMTCAHLYLVLKNKVPSLAGTYQAGYGQYNANVQQPNGYDSNGQPVYGQQANAQQQAYGYDYSAQNAGYGYDANAGQNAGYGYDANAGQNAGYGYNANAGQNAGYGYDVNAGQNAGYGYDANAGQNAGYGNDANSGMNSSFGYDANAYQNPQYDAGAGLNSSFGYEPDANANSGFGYDPTQNQENENNQNN